MIGEEWPPILPTEEIRRLLGGEPWCFPPAVVGDIDRDSVFDTFITEEVAKRGEEKPAPSYREIFFAHGRRIGDTWLQTEAAWQQRSKAS